MIDKFFVLLPKLILVIVVFALFWLISLGAQWIVEHFSQRYRQARNLGLVLGRLSHAIVIIVGLLIALTIVEAIETRATTIKTYDSRRVVIPNTELFTSL